MNPPMRKNAELKFIQVLAAYIYVGTNRFQMKYVLLAELMCCDIDSICAQLSGSQNDR